ncbi:MAG: excinuclease ABC subunit UvrC [Candidatus Omnitrophota bacterium]|nr:MAG: excinuclease ABC subunit UvrC [Candidatus Omnitrophota bacterium]
MKSFPDSPGVYLMKDKPGRILYVGKASSLKRRVSSYFQKPQAGKTRVLLSRTKDIEYIQTSSSAQALLLENSLIKKHRPYYNAALKDDKSYPYVKVDTPRAWGAVTITRGKKEKGAKYYGPYTSVKLLKSAIKTLRAVFPFRSCRRLPKKPCLYFQLKLCPGMCIKKIDKKVYRENLRQLGLFLEGKHKELISQLTDKMQKAAKRESFEEAAMLRDRITSLSEIITQTKETGQQELIFQLQKELNLTQAPRRIEAFDVSEIAGSGTVGSMVSFLDGKPDKNNYRKFKIKTVKGIDDYAMICEVLRRRFARALKSSLPDLIMIDGGKGHLSSARKELSALGLSKIPVIALAKRLENIYTPSGEVLSLPRDSKVLHLLQRIRNEAHRFAISYHRKLRQKDMRASFLDKIAGIGPKKKRALLRHFKSAQAIKKASVEDLLKVKGIDRKTAERIIKYLKLKDFSQFPTN